MTLVGQLPKERFINKFGFQPTQTLSLQTIWTGTPNIVGYPIAAIQPFISSTDSLDATTGAITGTLTGLNSAWEWQEESVVFSGHLPVQTTEFFNRTFRFMVDSAGSTGSNIGEIMVGAGSLTDGIPNSMYLHVLPEANQSKSAFFTIPEPYTGELIRAHFSSGQSDDLECNLYARPFGSVFQIKARIEIFRNTDNLEYEGNFFTPRTDLEMRGRRLSAGGNIGLSGLFDIHMTRI